MRNRTTTAELKSALKEIACTPPDRSRSSRETGGPVYKRRVNGIVGMITVLQRTRFTYDEIHYALFPKCSGGAFITGLTQFKTLLNRDLDEMRSRIRIVKPERSAAPRSESTIAFTVDGEAITN